MQSRRVELRRRRCFEESAKEGVRARLKLLLVPCGRSLVPARRAANVVCGGALSLFCGRLSRPRWGIARPRRVRLFVPFRLFSGGAFLDFRQVARPFLRQDRGAKARGFERGAIKRGFEPRGKGIQACKVRFFGGIRRFSSLYRILEERRGISFLLRAYLSCRHA